MGYAFDSFCYGTPDEAALQVCAKAYPTVAVISGQHVAIDCSGATAGVLSLRKTVDGVASSSFTYAPSLPSCDWMTFPSNPVHLSPMDGAALGAAVASVWASAWAWRAIQRVLSSDNESE